MGWFLFSAIYLTLLHSFLIIYMNDVTYFNDCITIILSRWQTFTHILKIITMPLLTILIVLVVVGVILWLINNYVPMDRKIKNILNVVAVIVVVIWLLQVFGVLGSLKNLKV